MKKLTYLFLALIIVACRSGDSDNEVNEPSNCLKTLIESLVLINISIATESLNEYNFIF